MLLADTQNQLYVKTASHFLNLLRWINDKDPENDTTNLPSILTYLFYRNLDVAESLLLLSSYLLKNKTA